MDQQIDENDIVFSQKILVWGKWTILDPKMVHPHNSGSALRIFLKFCTVKGGNRLMKVTLMVFTKKNLFGANGSFQT